VDLHLWLAFLAAVVVLMLIPGPNVALIVANSATYGVRFGLLTVLGTGIASAIQVSLAGLGLCTMLGQLGGWFAELRWAGVAYLVYLGIRQWRAAPIDLASVAPSPDLSGRIIRRAILVGSTNPKTLFFYGAFFPQFIRADAPPAPQVVILAATLLATAVTVDSGWALLAHQLRPLLRRRARLRNRLTGCLMIGAGATLAVARGT
jgi:homoserine/homoserine lactone efflux protein